ncbi:MAG: hypothetical protein H6553_06605 [Chitinophagales bacterium]|nr:hypothetical protein [Chitinophagales bacterium]
MREHIFEISVTLGNFNQTNWSQFTTPLYVRAASHNEAERKVLEKLKNDKDFYKVAETEDERCFGLKKATDFKISFIKKLCKIDF